MHEFDEQFNLRKRHPIARSILLQNELESWIAPLLLPCSLDVSYGDSAGQKLDIFPSQNEDAPVFVFIHGGYFRALDKRQYRFIARRTAKSGFTTVLVNYDLAPSASVAEIIQQNLKAFAWIAANIERWNGNPGNIILCGHSVGAFLAAKILEAVTQESTSIQKAALLSGLFDLDPMRRSFLNEKLGLVESDAEELNPAPKTPVTRPDVLVAVGANETDEFVKQSRNHSAALNQAGIANTCLVLPGINHYNMSRLLAAQNNPVMRWITSPRSEDTVSID